MPVADQDYVRSRRVGAEIGSEVFRKALRWAYATKSALIHVHAHQGRGTPAFSQTDLRSDGEFVPSFFVTGPRMPQAMIVLSDDAAAGLAWVADDRPPVEITTFSQVGTCYRRNWKDK